MSLYVHGLEIGLGLGMCELGPPVQIIIFYISFIFWVIMSVHRFYSWIVCLFINAYIHSTSFIKKKKRLRNSPREKIFLCINIKSKREKETWFYLQSTDLVMLILCVVDHFILGDIRSWVSNHHRMCEKQNLF